MAGRRPKTYIDTDKNHMSKREKEMRDNTTPVYQSQEFKAPDTLTTKEREVWDWLVKIFRETTNCMVSDADVHLMELYCRAKVAADEADAELKKDGRAYILVPLGKDKNGEVKTTAKPNPNIKKRHDNMVLCLKYFEELGLTPLARARAGVKGTNAKKDEDLFAKFMNRSDE